MGWPLMRQKLITLCDKSFDASLRMKGNFSAFVRKAVIAHAYGNPECVFGTIEDASSKRLLAVVLSRYQSRMDIAQKGSTIDEDAITMALMAVMGNNDIV
jgi:hypothetical protein